MAHSVKRIIRSKRKRGISRIQGDVVDVLLGDLDEQLTDDLIAENVIDMMIPGEDSVPILITLAVKYLSDSPAALEQIRVTKFS